MATWQKHMPGSHHTATLTGIVQSSGSTGEPLPAHHRWAITMRPRIDLASMSAVVCQSTNCNPALLQAYHGYVLSGPDPQVFSSRCAATSQAAWQVHVPISCS